MLGAKKRSQRCGGFHAKQTDSSHHNRTVSAGQAMLKQTFLVTAFVVVSIIALLYGVSPDWFASTFLGIANLDLNFAHILRAVMCLYLALGLFLAVCSLQ